MTGRRCSLCGEMDYSAWGDMPCACSLMAEQASREPTARDICEAEGHPYYGDEGPGDGLGRCYCGERWFPLGGPEQTVTTTTPGVTPAPS